MSPERAWFFRWCKSTIHRNSCWKLTLFHNLHRFFHSVGIVEKSALNFDLVYIIFKGAIRLFSAFCCYWKIADEFHITRKICSWQTRFLEALTEKIPWSGGGWAYFGRISGGLDPAGGCKAPIYSVQVGFVPQGRKNMRKNAENF